MKILFSVPRYVPDYNSGDSIMAHQMATYLQSVGHEVQVIVTGGNTYVYEGIHVQGFNVSLFRWADLVFCQLDTTQTAIKLARCPVIWIMHNTFEYPTIRERQDVGVIFNSRFAIKETGLTNKGYVLTPPVSEDYNLPIRFCTYITLINCNENKGGKIFHKIAQAMPEEQFIQVKGAYGEQFLAQDYNKGARVNLDNSAIETGLGKLPNVTVLEHTNDIKSIYKITEILLMPSLYESWGKVATEAMMSGIPVIHTNTFGLRENCGEGSNYIKNRDDINEWVMQIKKVKKEYDKCSAYASNRARTHNAKKNLAGLNDFLVKFVEEHPKKKEYVLQPNS